MAEAKSKESQMTRSLRPKGPLFPVPKDPKPLSDSKSERLPMGSTFAFDNSKLGKSKKAPSEPDFLHAK